MKIKPILKQFKYISITFSMLILLLGTMISIVKITGIEIPVYTNIIIILMFILTSMEIADKVMK